MRRRAGITLDDFYWASKVPLWDAKKNRPITGDYVAKHGQRIVEEFEPRQDFEMAVILEEEGEEE